MEYDNNSKCSYKSLAGVFLAVAGVIWITVSSANADSYALSHTGLTVSAHSEYRRTLNVRLCS
jgi:hypothetical protein